LSIVRLCAELDDGTIVEGESNIPHAKRPIKRVFFEPDLVEPLNEVIDAIRDADAIILGPGSLFTSILPNFLIDRVTREVAHAHAVKIYVCNVMTQPGETENMTAADHVESLFSNAGARVCDYVVVNSEPPSKLLEAYAEEHQVPVTPDVARIAELGLVPIEAQMISETQTVRHDSQKLADIVFSVIDGAIAERATFVKPARAYQRNVSQEAH
jgi:uncharacterized cofD-like protein